LGGLGEFYGRGRELGELCGHGRELSRGLSRGGGRCGPGGEFYGPARRLGRVSRRE